jgi:hypothetical protein
MAHSGKRPENQVSYQGNGVSYSGYPFSDTTIALNPSPL